MYLCHAWLKHLFGRLQSKYMEFLCMRKELVKKLSNKGVKNGVHGEEEMLVLFNFNMAVQASDFVLVYTMLWTNPSKIGRNIMGYWSPLQ